MTNTSIGSVRHYCIHFLAYQLVWLQAIFLAASGYRWLPLLIAIVIVNIQLAWQQKIDPVSPTIFRFVFLFLAGGFVGDSILQLLGFIRFNGSLWGLTAPFVLGIWLGFAVTFFCTLMKWRKRYFLLAILSLIGFPLAYGAGVALGAATFGPWGLLAVTGLWTALFPTILWLYNTGSEHVRTSD